MKNEWTEQDLRRFVESSRPVFQDVSLTQVDEDADRCWQDDGLMVDYELRGGQVDCVLRRCVVADGITGATGTNVNDAAVALVGEK